MQFDDEYLEEEYGDDIATYPTQTQARRIPGMSRPQPEADYRRTESLSRVPSRASNAYPLRRSSSINADTTHPDRGQKITEQSRKQQVKSDQRRAFFRRMGNIGLYGGSVAIGGAAVALLGVSIADRNHEDTIQGKSAASTLLLQCGHADSNAHKTLLHAFVEQEDGIYTRVHFLEYPGGALPRLRPYQSDDLRTKYDSAELSRVVLQMDAMPVGGGKYQIQLTLTLSQKNIISIRPDPIHILLVDGGDYFVPVEVS